MEGEIEQTRAPGPSEILSWLYLGSKYHYFDSDNLKSLGVLSNRPDNRKLLSIHHLSSGVRVAPPVEWLWVLTCGRVLAPITGITHVLNVVGGRYPSDIPKDQFEIIPLSDYGTDKLDKKLTPCFEFLRTQHQPLCVRVRCCVCVWLS